MVGESVGGTRPETKGVIACLNGTWSQKQMAYLATGKVENFEAFSAGGGRRGNFLKEQLFSHFKNALSLVGFPLNKGHYWRFMNEAWCQVGSKRLWGSLSLLENTRVIQPS